MGSCPKMFLIKKVNSLVEKLPAFDMQGMPRSRYFEQLGIPKIFGKKNRIRRRNQNVLRPGYDQRRVVDFSQCVRTVEFIDCHKLSMKCVLRLKGRQKLQAVVFFYHFRAFGPEFLTKKQGSVFAEDFLAAEPRIVYEERYCFRRG